MVALGLEGRRKAEASCLGQGGFRAASVGEMLDFFFFFFWSVLRCCGSGRGNVPILRSRRGSGLRLPTASVIPEALPTW